MAIARLRGTELSYVEQGAGDPVVLVHGTLGDLRSWEPQMDALSNDHRVIACSRRFHHPDRWPGRGPDYTAELHADDLAALLDALGIAAAHIVGSSYGAYVALLLALRHPERVRTLVLSEPPVLPLLDDHPEGRPLRDAFLAEVWAPTGRALARGEVEVGLRTFVDGLFGGGAFGQLPAHVLELLRDNASEFAAETSSPGFWTPFDHATARRVTSPTLLLSGEESLRMLILVVDELERCLPDNRRVRIPRSGHDLPGDQTDVYNAVVLDFLSRHQA